MEEAKLIKAKKGAKGGYLLVKKPKNITVGEIIRTLEGTLAPVFCIAKEKDKRILCPRKKNCKTKNVWKKIQKILNISLNSITLADLNKD